MSSLLADTHALIWYIVEPDQLSSNAITAFDETTNAGNLIYISAISLVEICYLVEKGRLTELVLKKVTAAINDTEPLLVVIPVDMKIGLTVRQINRATVPDMPDRIIAATALYLNLPLVTRDAKIKLLANIQTIW